MGYFGTMNAQQIAHAAARASVTGKPGPYRGTVEFSRARAELWITSTADLEGVRLDSPAVALARRWLAMVSAVSAQKNEETLDVEEARKKDCSCGWAFGERVSERDRCDSCQEFTKLLEESAER